MGRFRGHGGCRPPECPGGPAPRGPGRAGGGARYPGGGGGAPPRCGGSAPPGQARGAGPGGPAPAELQGHYALWAVRAPGTGREGSAS